MILHVTRAFEVIMLPNEKVMALYLHIAEHVNL